MGHSQIGRYEIIHNVDLIKIGMVHVSLPFYCRGNYSFIVLCCGDASSNAIFTLHNYYTMRNRNSAVRYGRKSAFLSSGCLHREEKGRFEFQKMGCLGNTMI